MGIWKNTAIAAILQTDYGFSPDFASMVARSATSEPTLPGTDLNPKKLKKHEIAGWAALTTCLPPDGLKVGDFEYLSVVELTIARYYQRGKIRPLVMATLHEMSEFIRTQQ